MADPCAGANWSPIASASAQSVLCGVLAGVTFLGMVAIWTAESPEQERNDDWPTNRSYALQLFAASFIIFAVDSYLASITSGELSCNRAEAEAAFSGGVLGIAAVVMVAGLAWLLVSMSEHPDRNLIAVLRYMLAGIGTLIVVMLAVSAQGIGQALLGSRDPWFVNWAPYVIGLILACGAVYVAWSTSRLKAEPRPEADPIDLAVRRTCIFAVGDAIISAILTGATGALPESDWLRPPTAVVYLIVVASMVMPGFVLVVASRPAIAVVTSRNSKSDQNSGFMHKVISQVTHRAASADDDPPGSEVPAAAVGNLEADTVEADTEEAEQPSDSS